MKKLFCCLIFAGSAFGQWATFPATSYTALNTQFNGLLAFQAGAGVPSFNCTVGKDVATNTSTGAMYWCTATNTWTLILASGSPAIGTATATSLLATGIVDGAAPVTITTGASATLGGTYKSGYTFNEEATAATAITYTLPTAAAGLQYCVANAYGGAADTGTLEILTSASGQYIIFTDGTLSATGGYVISGGAARDSACVVGVDSTHWMLYPSSGTWAKH